MMFGGIGMSKSLCTVCFYQEKTSAICNNGICIKCGAETLTLHGWTQIPKPNASKRVWRDWINWAFPEPYRDDPFRRAGWEQIGPSERDQKQAAIRALLLHSLEKRKRRG
jgi:hypothetical protein